MDANEQPAVKQTSILLYAVAIGFPLIEMKRSKPVPAKNAPVHSEVHEDKVCQSWSGGTHALNEAIVFSTVLCKGIRTMQLYLFT